jgi:hypothetical protein
MHGTFQPSQEQDSASYRYPALSITSEVAVPTGLEPIMIR